MTVEQAVLERVRSLPPDKQREVLDFAEFLNTREASAVKHPRRSARGLCADLVERAVTSEEIDEARREMWGNFPREDIA